MKLDYDKDYTKTFHSLGIEPWISGFLKSKGSLGKVLDVGCSFGFSALLLKSYLSNAKYLVGVDISPEKISKARRLNLYDELYVADIQDLNPESKFDTLIALEVLHALPASILAYIENFVKKGVHNLSLASLPEGGSVRDLIDRGYVVYRYLLRGLVMVDLKHYNIYLAGQSRFLKAIKILLTILKPILKVTKVLERGYLLAFKQVRR